MCNATDTVPGIDVHAGGQVTLSGPALALEQQVDGWLRDWGMARGAQEYRFPACIEARQLARLDYFEAFPHLATYPVTLDPADLPDQAGAGGISLAADGTLRLPPPRAPAHVLTPAACYHVYIALEGRRLDAPLLVTTRATCFRNEVRLQALQRQWSFDMREVVCIGEESEVQAFLADAARAVQAMATRLGIAAGWQQATDPFYRPAASARHLYQLLEPVKRELCLEEGLAIASTNFHRDHFGAAFDIRRAGRAACSGCVAIGLERWLAAAAASAPATLAGGPLQAAQSWS